MGREASAFRQRRSHERSNVATLITLLRHGGGWTICDADQTYVWMEEEIKLHVTQNAAHDMVNHIFGNVVVVEGISRCHNDVFKYARKCHVAYALVASLDIYNALLRDNRIVTGNVFITRSGSSGQSEICALYSADKSALESAMVMARLIYSDAISFTHMVAPDDESGGVPPQSGIIDEEMGSTSLPD